MVSQFHLHWVIDLDNPSCWWCLKLLLKDLCYVRRTGNWTLNNNVYDLCTSSDYISQDDWSVQILKTLLTCENKLLFFNIQAVAWSIFIPITYLSRHQDQCMVVHCLGPKPNMFRYGHISGRKMVALFIASLKPGDWQFDKESIPDRLISSFSTISRKPIPGNFKTWDQFLCFIEFWNAKDQLS